MNNFEPYNFCKKPCFSIFFHSTSTLYFKKDAKKLALSKINRPVFFVGRRYTFYGLRDLNSGKRNVGNFYQFFKCYTFCFYHSTFFVSIKTSLKPFPNAFIMRYSVSNSFSQLQKVLLLRFFCYTFSYFATIRNRIENVFELSETI